MLCRSHASSANLSQETALRFSERLELKRLRNLKVVPNHSQRQTRIRHKVPDGCR